MIKLTTQELGDLVSNRSSDKPSKLGDYGGVYGISARLGVNHVFGIGDFEVLDRRAVYGSNLLGSPKLPTYLELLVDAFKDVTMIILTVAACVSFTVALAFEKTLTSLAESIAIFISILVVTNVSAFNDWKKQRQFAKLQAVVSDVSVVALRNGGKRIDIKTSDVVVGDILFLSVGEIACADGLLVEGERVTADESSLTGESKLIRKDLIKNPFILSGTKIVEGEGKYLVIAVGKNSESGQISTLVTGGDEKERGGVDQINNGKSVLTAKLDRVVIIIGKIGLIISTICFLAMSLIFAISRFMIRNKDTVCAHFPAETRTCADLYSEMPICGSTTTSLSHCCSSSTGDGVRVVGSPCPWIKRQHLGELISFLITAITILVVAVPEGLPLAVTLSLAFSVFRMQKDNNLVKHLDACETMGSATTICSDKTGTLTKNRMSVVKCIEFDEGGDKDVIMEECILSNSSGASEIHWNEASRLWDQVGNKTECALLAFIQETRGGGVKHSEYYREARQKLRCIYKIPFSSERKRSVAVVVRNEGERETIRVYMLGASEIVLGFCVVDEEVDKLVATSVISSMAKQAMRTIGLAYRDIGFLDSDSGKELLAEINHHGTGNGVKDDQDGDGERDRRLERLIEKDLKLLAIMGIEDPLRDEVPAAILACRRAGVDVRMVTGDNIETAIAIARNCGILRSEDFDQVDNNNTPLKYRVMTGVEFRELVTDRLSGKIVQEVFDEIWPYLRVLARSSPTDKYILVSGIIQSDLFKTETGKMLGIYHDRQIVAVTGDGTNDAPALKKADIGFAMGISGTQIAKDAADIILLDDNFSSIVKACKWGRNIYDSVAKFLQFQLTINIVAIVLAVEGSFVFSESPLKAVQMLWVNLIMDCVASLALATEPPSESQLNRPPYGRNSSILSPAMICNIVGHSIYQLFVLNILLFFGPALFGFANGSDEGGGYHARPSKHHTLIFNTFVCMQLCNQINSRKLYHEWNVFKDLFNNSLFIIIGGLELVLQVLLVQWGGDFFRTAPLDVNLWMVSVLLGLISFPVQILIVVLSTSFTVRTRKPWMKTSKKEKEESKHAIVITDEGEEVHEDKTRAGPMKRTGSSASGGLGEVVSMLSSKVLSGLLGDVPTEEQLLKTGSKPGFRRNRTREIRDAEMLSQMSKSNK